MADLDKYKGKLKDAIVLTQGEQDMTISFEPMAIATARDRPGQAHARARAGRPPAAEPPDAGRGRPPAAPAGRSASSSRPRAPAVSSIPAAASSARSSSRAAGRAPRAPEMPLPSIVVANEHYNRIVRILQKDIPVDARDRGPGPLHGRRPAGHQRRRRDPGHRSRSSSPSSSCSAATSTPGTRAPGPRTTAAGCAVAFEAMRILKALGVKPRRTIRMALWDAEEQGFVGSRGYVANHFFDRTKKEKKPEYDKLSAYFNFDNGSGKIRGIYAQSNSAVVPIFEAWLEPVRDLGAATVTLRNTGGTDHLPFDAVGLPGFQFIQDDLEYDTLTHHSNMDVIDHVSRPDLDPVGHGHGLVRLQRRDAGREAAAEVLRRERAGASARPELIRSERCTLNPKVGQKMGDMIPIS
ncbi:MAG: M20/M25/M40 family metallo-hydrolase [Candidatus Moduliflexus flocculans]|nr:M20/M25/M40 family metallo-hydrolase [Candidatus Moduliflexus flocculans]